MTARYDWSSRHDPGSYDNSDVKVFDLPSPTPCLDFKETSVQVAAISHDDKLLALPSHRWGVKGSTLLSPVGVAGDDRPRRSQNYQRGTEQSCKFDCP